MKKIRILILITTLVLSGTAVIASAVGGQPGRKGPMPLNPRLGYGPRGSGPVLQRPLLVRNPVDHIQTVMKRLELTDTQKEQIKDILKTQKEGMKQAQEARGVAMKAFGQAVEAGDEAAIRAAGTEVGNAMAKGALNRIQRVAAIKAVLTPEQAAKLEKMKEVAGRPIRRPLGDRVDRPMPDRVNRSGKVGRAEVPGRLGHEMDFQRMDRNRDGAITQREFKAFQGQKAKGRPARNRNVD